MRWTIALGALALTATTLASLSALGQAAEPSFSTRQIGRGAGQFRAVCANCHGELLEGKASHEEGLAGPTLVGEEFRKTWRGKTAAALYEYVSTKMPADKPGKLAPDVYLDILAFLLQQANGKQGAEIPDLPATEIARISLK